MSDLLTKEDISKIPAMYSSDGRGMSAVAYVHLLHPRAGHHWFILEGHRSRALGIVDFKAFGLVIGQDLDWGYFMLRELEINGVVKDPLFRPCALREAISRLLGSSWARALSNY